MPKRTQRYEDALLTALADPNEAAAYLLAHLKEEGRDAEPLFLMALRDVARAQSITAVAARAALGRESLYKSLSARGNPKWTTLKAILDAVGLSVSIEPKATPSHATRLREDVWLQRPQRLHRSLSPSKVSAAAYVRVSLHLLEARTEGSAPSRPQNRPDPLDVGPSIRLRYPEQFELGEQPLAA